MTSNSERLLLTEGRDDEHILRNLLLHRKIPVLTADQRLSPPTNAIEVKGFTGYDQLARSISKEASTRSNLSFVGVVADFDTAEQQRWASLCRKLERAFSVDFPASPPNDGFQTKNSDGVTVGVWLMPDNRTNGAIEHFYKGLIRSGNTLLDHAHGVVDSLPEKPFMTAHPDAADAYREKAIIHTWLAWQSSPGRRMGEPIGSDLFDLTCPAADSFIAWIKRLFAL